MPKRKKDDEGSGDEWTPPLPVKEKPKNAHLLACKAKKARFNAKLEVRCDECGRKFTTRKQMRDHKRSHGR